VARNVPPHAAASSQRLFARAVPLGNDSSVSEVPLVLHLTATHLGRNSREGYANIGVNVLSPQTYRAGAILANGARLEEIYADFVVLTRDAYRTNLYLDDRSRTGNDLPALTSLITVGGAPLIRPAVADSEDKLTEFVRIAPVFAGDQVRALELYPSANAILFAQLGLEPGDRVIAIDGAAVQDSRAAIGELRRLTAGAALNVTIERGEKSLTLSLNGSILRSGERG